jgi:hypothetical protein
VKNDSILSADVKGDTLKGGDIDESTLTIGSAGSVNGLELRKISLVANGVVAEQELLNFKGLVLRGGCATSGDEDVILTPTVNDGEMTSVSVNGSGTVAAVNRNDFDVGETANVGGAGNQAVYEIRYVGGDGQSVQISLSAESSLPNNNCLITGFAAG